MDREDLKKAMQKAQEMQAGLIKAHEELSRLKVEGADEEGLVKITMTAEGEFKNVRISTKALDLGHRELENAILSALRSASTQAGNITKETLSNVSKQVGL